MGVIDVDYQDDAPPRESKYLAHPDVLTEPCSMEALAKAEQGRSIGVASMEHEGTDRRVHLACSLFLPSIPVMLFDKGLSLTALQFMSSVQLQQLLKQNGVFLPVPLGIHVHY